MKEKRWVIIPLVLFFLIQIVYAAEPNHIISNSEQWTDVYSTILYANILGKDSSFLVSSRHAPILLSGISKSTVIQIISSKDYPFYIGYENMIESKGYPDAEELEFDNVNLELAKRLEDIKRFIILDDSYGYNAIAVAPYAAKKKAYVLFADKRNIDDIEGFLNDREVEELLIYGHVDREVREALSDLNPVIIDTGDRFDDNVEIVKKYRSEITPAKQIILSNGEFIEKEIMSGAEPVLFIGKENVPSQIKNYIKSTDIEVAVLIGNELINTATNVRRDVGISTFVKFARGARNPGGSIASVEGLDLFYLPTYNLNLAISSIKYNKATNHLEVTYKNNVDIATYFKGTITLISDSGEKQRLGDVEPVFIEGNDLKTVVYSDINLAGESYEAQVFTLYGESKKSLEKVIEGTYKVEIINVLDDCEIEIKGASYHTRKDSFFIEIENTGPTDCYINIELKDIIVDNKEATLGLKGVESLKLGEIKEFAIPYELTEEDLAKNEEIEVIVYYGQRENSLTKFIKGKFQLILKKFLTGGDIVFYSVIIVIFILILLFILKRRRRDEEEMYRGGSPY